MANLTQVTLASGVPQESGTVSTIDALLALAATAAKQDTSNTSLASILAKLADPATQTTLAAVLAKLNASIAVTGTFWQATQPVSGTFFQATQPVSAASLPLPSGAATSALQTTGNTSLAALAALISSGKLLVTASIDSASVNANGQTTMSASAPVVIASDQSPVSTQLAPAANLVSGAITTAMTATTTTSLIAAPGASLRNYITTIVVSNSHATVGTDVVIQDGSGGATLMTIPAAALYGGGVISLPAPLRQPTANTAIFCANVTTGASTKVSAVGFKAA